MPTLDGLPHLATARELHPCHGSSDRPIGMAAAEAIALGLATSVETLLKHYGHHNPDHQSEIAEAISSRPRNARRIR